MRNKRIKALILAAMVTVTSAALAGCSKSSDDELITVNESDLDSMSNEEIESIIVHNAEVLEQADSTTAETEPELPVYNIWDDVVVTPDNEKRSGMYEENRGAFIIEYTGDNEDEKEHCVPVSYGESQYAFHSCDHRELVPFLAILCL